MKAFVGELDHCGLRRLLPADTDANYVLDLRAKSGFARPTALVWALLRDEQDAEAVRLDVGAGRHVEACGLLLNRAVELVVLGSVGPGTTSTT